MSEEQVLTTEKHMNYNCTFNSIVRLCPILMKNCIKFVKKLSFEKTFQCTNFININYTVYQQIENTGTEELNLYKNILMKN